MNVKSIASTCCPPFLIPLFNRIENSPIGYRLAKGMFWSMAGAVISRGLMLGASVLVARMLGKVGFGELGIIQSTVGMFGVFAGFGLGLTATKHVAEFRVKDPAKAGRIMALSGLVAIGSGGTMALVLVIFAPWLAAHTLAAPHLSGLLQISAVLLFLSALNGAQTGALSGFEAFKTIARVNLLAGFATFPLMVGGAYLAGLQGAVWGLVASMGVNWILNHMALRVEGRNASVPFSFADCGQEWKILWRFSLPAVLSGVMVGPVQWACNVMLVNQPNGYAEMGIFNAANQWRLALMFLPSILMSALLPVLSHEHNEGTDSFNKALNYSHKMVFLAVLPVSFIMMALSKPIMTMYGAEFVSGRTALIYILAATAVSGIGSPAGTAIQSLGKMWLGFLMNLSHGVVYLMLSFFLIRSYGATGMSLGLYIAYLFLAIWAYVYLLPMLPKGMFAHTLAGMGFILLASLGFQLF